MQYVFLIYTDEAQDFPEGSPEQDAHMAGYFRFPEEVQRHGAAIVGGQRLRPVATATSVRVRSGNALTTDGPFAETREQLGGFYVLDCPDLDVALKLAAALPGASAGTVEVRPVWEMGGE